MSQWPVCTAGDFLWQPPAPLNAHLFGPGHRPCVALGYLGASFLRHLISWVGDEEKLMVKEEGPEAAAGWELMNNQSPLGETSEQAVMPGHWNVP